MKLKLYIGQEETIQEENGSIVTITSSPSTGGTDSISFDYYTNWPLTNAISTVNVPLIAVPFPYSNEQMASDYKAFLTILYNNLTVDYVSGDTFVTIFMDNGSPIFNYVFSNSFGSGQPRIVDVITTNYIPIDLYKDETMELTSKLNDIEKLSNIFSDFSNSFTVPANDINNELFKHYYDIDNDNTFNANIRVLAYIEIDSIPLRYGKLQLESITLKNQRPDSYKITFFGSLIQLSDLFGDDTIDRLDYKYDKITKTYNKVWSSLSQFDYDYTRDNFFKSLTSPSFMNGDVMTPLIEFGNLDWNYGNGNSDSVKDISINSGAILQSELRPALRILRIFEAIETKYNISFTREFLNKAVVFNLYMWLNNKQEDILLNNYDINITSPWTGPNNGAAVYNGNYISLTRRLYSGFGAVEYRALMEWGITPNDNSVSYDILLVNEFDTVVAQVLNVSGPQNISQSWVSSFDFNDNPETITETLKLKIRPYSTILFSVDAHVNYYRHAASIDTIWVDQYSINNSQTLQVLITMLDNIPKLKVIDFIQGVMKQFKLIIRPITSNSFYLNTLDGYYGDGNILDLTDYVDVKEVSIERPLIYKNINFKYQKTNNFLGEKFRKLNDPINQEIGYGDLKATYENIETKEELKIELPFENMLFERMSYYSSPIATPILTKINIGQSISSSDNGKTFSPNQSKPILFFNNGLVDVDPYPYIVNFNGFLTGLTMTQLIGNTNDELISQVTDTINFGAEIDPWHMLRVDNSLYLNYWSNWVNTIYDLKQRKITYKSNNLPSRYVQELSLNDRLIIGNQRYKINDYTINLTDGSTNFTLFKDIYEWDGYSFPSPIINQNRSFTPNGWYNTDFASTDTNAFIYGSFSGYNGNSYGKIIKLNIDGSVDTTFSTGTGFNNNSYSFQSMLLQDNGKLMFAGNFTTYNAASFGRIVRLNSDGSVDSTFNSGTGFNSLTSAVKIDSQGKYFVAGSYSAYSGVTANRIVKLNSNGTIDSTFNSGTGFNNVTNDIIVNSDDSIFVSGYFTSYNGTAKSHLVKLTTGGTIDTSFADGGFTIGGSQPIGMVQSNGLICYGYFTAYSGVSTNRIVKLNDNGSINQLFLANMGTGFNDIIYNAKLIFGDKILVRGAFNTYNGITSLGIIILNNDGTIYRTFETAYLNVYPIGDKLYGNLNNGPQILIFNNDFPVIPTSSIIMNAGSKYFGVDIITKDSWVISDFIDYGFGVDWVEFISLSGTGSTELVFKVKDKSNQTVPSVNNPRNMSFLIKIGDMKYGINVTQNGLS